ncbi:XRE family transcriptional regulator [Flavobacterium cauense R2A-7]|uniref:Helix-turn-helix protein n=1 Tax=Flavobacterium cauense R2A-7 TaxID=1341154 RepID=V6RXX0_9FLAO|nr:helix-turn-helix transcriptional regulator [Flavobacterium cauense]ESU18872.1 XRE family transcriptional regulator [Flavobacterium cauense R2A-7]KGO81660.1 DNA-binding protein [Flavobacterium cauense R2A-7]TWI13689.1 helix-turn-helix protein [Flavobacterium cauense R2A-7]
MVNTEDFVKRLEIILEYYGLSASGFADKIGVQRSSLSHLLSGRNKPSLDFILKIIEVFPEVDLYWILNGKGNFPKSEPTEKSISVSDPTPTLFSENKTDEVKFENQPDLFSAEPTVEKNRVFENHEENFSNTRNFRIPKTDSDIDQIVVFYKNGTFKNYFPE